jgi:shikimate kinase
MQQLFLVGYMGSGKSTLGKVLAQNLNCPFIDLDAWIEDQEGVSVAQLFKEKGELYFRKQEHHHLKKLLEDPAPKVVALGGGTPCYYNNMELLQKASNVKTVYLNASVSFLAKRLLPEKQQRPLIQHLDSESALREFIGKHLFERLPFYQKASQSLMIEGKTVADLVSAVTS